MDDLRSAAISAPAVPHSEVDGEAATTRPTFLLPELQSRFERDGFVVVPFLSPETIRAVLEVWDDVGPAPGDPGTGFFPGNASSDPEWKRTVVERVTPLIETRVAELCDDHHIFHLTFMTKWPGPDGVLHVHQDSTMVERESVNHALNFWCPLNPEAADPASMGTLRILPGSHRLPSGSWYRARGGYFPSGLEGIETDVFDRLAEPISPPRGHAVGFDHRVIHCSWPNSSSVPRLVLAIGLRPTEAASVHVEFDPDSDEVRIHRVDDDYFVQHPHVDMSEFPVIHRATRRPAPVADLEQVLDAIAATSWAPPPAGAATDTTPAPARLRHRRTRPPVLTDRRLDRRLRRDGFVKVQLLDRSTASSLRDRYVELHGLDGEGFQVDFWSDEPDYRRATDAEIASATDAAFAELFHDHEPFLRNFLCKWPGPRDPEGFPEAPHRDWMYTDERDGAFSYVAWIALEDIDHDNGQLQVARGSHRLDDGLRGMNIETPWLEHRDVWRSRMLAVPARCGEAIITHAALVHGSYSNHSNQPRVVAAVALAPRGVDLVHHRRADDTTATRYLVDREFFLTQDVAELAAGAVTHPATRRVPIGGADLDPVELAGRLDRPLLARLDRALGRTASPPESPTSTAPAD